MHPGPEHKLKHCACVRQLHAQSQATLQCTPRAPVCISICKVQLTRLAPACTGICNLQCTWGRGANVSALRAPRPWLREMPYAWDIAGGVSRIASACGPGGRGRGGVLPGASPAPAPGAQGGEGGGCAWLGWSCSPFNKRRRASPPPPRPFSGGSSRPAQRAPPPGPGRRRRRVPPRPSLGPARAAGSGRSGRRNPFRRRQRQRRSETEEDAAPACRARSCGRRRRIGGGAQRGRCSGRGSGERGVGGGVARRRRQEPSPGPAPARPTLLRGAFSAPAAPRSGSLGPLRGCSKLPRAPPSPRLRDGKLAPRGRLRQRRPPLLLLTASR